MLPVGPNNRLHNPQQRSALGVEHRLSIGTGQIFVYV